MKEAVVVDELVERFGALVREIARAVGSEDSSGPISRASDVVYDIIALLVVHDDKTQAWVNLNAAISAIKQRNFRSDVEESCFDAARKGCLVIAESTVTDGPRIARQNTAIRNFEAAIARMEDAKIERRLRRGDSSQHILTQIRIPRDLA